MTFLEWFIRCCFAYIHFVSTALKKFRCFFLLSSIVFRSIDIENLALILAFNYALILIFLFYIYYNILYFCAIVPHSNAFNVFMNNFSLAMLHSLFPVTYIYFSVFPLITSDSMKFIIFKLAFIYLSFLPY
jgi:hypothetical protein